MLVKMDFHAMVYSQLMVVNIAPAEPEGKTTGVEIQKQELRQKLRESTCQDHRHRARLYNQVLQLQLDLKAAKVKEFHSTAQIAALQEQMIESNKRAETLLRQERIAAELLREATGQILQHLMTTTSQLDYHLSAALLKCKQLKQMMTKSRKVVHRVVFELWRENAAVEKQNTQQSAVATATVATAQDASRPAMQTAQDSGSKPPQQHVVASAFKLMETKIMQGITQEFNDMNNITPSAKEWEMEHTRVLDTHALRECKRWASKALWRLSHDAAGHVQDILAEGIKLLLKTMTARLDDLQVQEHACRVLQNLGGNEQRDAQHSIRCIAAAGGISLLLRSSLHTKAAPLYLGRRVEQYRIWHVSRNTDWKWSKKE